MRSTTIGLFAALSLLVPACGSSHETVSTTPEESRLVVSSSKPAERSAQELAKLTADAYRQAERLYYRAISTQSRGDKEEWRLWCIVEHGLNYYCDLDVRDTEGLVFELHVRGDGRVVRIKEVNHRGGERQEYELPYTDYGPTKWSIRSEKIVGCRFGTHLISWVGCESEKASFLEDAISQGAWSGAEEVDGHPCDVVQTHRVKGLDERFYLDRETHVIRRWTMTHKGVIRDRVFSEIVLTKRAQD